MKIIVDAFGGDNAPLEILRACEMAVKNLNIQFILTGKEEIIRNTANENNISLENMEIINAPTVVTMDDAPSSVVKGKKDSSMAVGLKLLSDSKADAFISAGNSGALVYGATFIVKRIKNIKRPAFAPIMPKDNGKFMLIDSGANLDCRPEVLSQFAMMGSVYMEKVEEIKNPSVGLANVGVEAEKGTEILKQTYALLKESELNFIGNIEARDIPQNGADVVVADGFTGNMLLKMFEGTASVLMKKIKGVFKRNLKTKLAAILVMPQMKAMKKQIDYREHGGAPVLGVAKPVFKAHGSSDAYTYYNAINLLLKYSQSCAIEEIEKAAENKNKKEG